MQYLSELDEEMSSKCSDLKSCIESLESDFTQQLQELTVSLERNEERYSEDHRLTQEKITAISEKVYETRQIISGASATSKVTNICFQFVFVNSTYFYLLFLSTRLPFIVCRFLKWPGKL